MAMDLKSFGSAVTQIMEEKGIPKEKVIDTIEMALAAAYKRDYASRGENIRVKLDPESGTMEVFKVFLVVDESMLKPEKEEGGDAAEGEGEMKNEEERADDDAHAAHRENTQNTTQKHAEKRKREDEDDESDEENDDEVLVRFNPERHMMAADAKQVQKGIKAGEELLVALEPHEDFGRIAAQTAKQVIMQRLREVERETIAEEYAEKVGEIISGIVQRFEARTAFVDLGRGVGVLFPQEQIPGERIRIGARVRMLLREVNMTPKGPQIILSRAHPDFVRELFKMEVPEIASEAVEIKAIAREAGSRTKIAVMSHQDGVDPIGACIGQRGTRVLTVMNELSGEKIDVIEWSEDAEEFIANALSPAKVTDVELRERATATVRVPEDQMSLAIGRDGQNVRLAVKLTNWKIDIEGAEEFLEEEEEDEESGDEESGNGEEGDKGDEGGGEEETDQKESTEEGDEADDENGEESEEREESKEGENDDEDDESEDNDSEEDKTDEETENDEDDEKEKEGEEGEEDSDGEEDETTA